MRKGKVILVIIYLMLFPFSIQAGVSDYLILEDIGPYRLFTGVPGRVFSGPPTKYSQTSTGGVLDAAGHFSENDVSYECSYTEPGGRWPFVKVEVTQHAGGDSDRWLLHEVEDGYRDNDDSDGRLGLLSGAGVKIREIDGNKIFYWGLGGGSYSWVSRNNIVIEIKYVDLQRTKPEPLSVVKAYLNKHPSLITLTDSDLKSKAHNERWIKNEMERRLWLCEKWFLHLQMGKVPLDEALDSVVKSMVVFLDYREKYYGIKSKDEKVALATYLEKKDGTSIKNRLSTYKTWWGVNKGRSITLP
ncbi:MAG: hypothetical protein N2Z74_04730 [Syntrophales bacterium]|nr:hypothetical protein [Syntrophales bacterium]